MKSKSVIVDVIIPTFNSQEFFLEAVNSCLAQTYPINKIIVVDDGSSDDFVDYLLELTTHIPKLNLIRNHHTGHPGIGRQIGVDASNAEWIAFLDSDDWWTPEKIEKQIRAAEFSDSSLVYSNAWLMKPVGNAGLFFKRVPPELSFQELLATNWLINSSVITKREVLNKTLYATSTRVKGAEDYATWLRLATACKFQGVDEPLTYYRDFGGSFRSLDDEEPRIHGLADFIEWAHACEPCDKRRMRKFIKQAIKSIENQYLPR